MKWFYYPFWKYLLSKPCSWRKFWCRASGHPRGPIWYRL